MTADRPGGKAPGRSAGKEVRRMKTIKFTVEDGTHGNTSDEAFAMPDEDPADTIVRSVVDSLVLDIQVITAGNVTATLAMWQNPEHWEEDWAEALEHTGFETFDEYVASL
jgi:hypothetical protein